MAPIHMTFIYRSLIFVVLVFTLAGCSDGDSATSSGGPTFTNVAGNWTGTINDASVGKSSALSLGIVFVSDTSFNGVAELRNSNSDCLVSGTLEGEAFDGEVRIVISNSAATLVLTGEASPINMNGIFVVSEVHTPAQDDSSTADDDSDQSANQSTSENIEDCVDLSGDWKVNR